MTELFGLPAHPLLVHAPIVFAPIAVTLCLFALARTKGPLWLPLAAVLTTGGTAVSMFLAKQSGESFESALIDGGVVARTTVQRHADLGDTTFVFAAVMFFAVSGAFVLRRFRERSPRWKLANTVLTGVVVVLGVLLVVWTVRTGHEGAKLVWDGVLE